MAGRFGVCLEFSICDIRLPGRHVAIEQTIGGESPLLRMPAQQFAQDLVPLCGVRGHVSPSFQSDAPTPIAHSANTPRAAPS